MRLPATRIAAGAVLVAFVLAACEQTTPTTPPPTPPPIPVDRTPKTWTVEVAELADWPGARAMVDGQERIGGDAIAKATALKNRPSVGPVTGDVVTLRFTSAWSTSRKYTRSGTWAKTEPYNRYIDPGTWTATVDSGADWATARKAIGGKIWTGGNTIALAVAYSNRPGFGPVVGDLVTLNSAPGTVPPWSQSVLYGSRGF